MWKPPELRTLFYMILRCWLMKLSLSKLHWQLQEQPKALRDFPDSLNWGLRLLRTHQQWREPIANSGIDSTLIPLTFRSSPQIICLRSPMCITLFQIAGPFRNPTIAAIPKPANISTRARTGTTLSIAIAIKVTSPFG